MFSWSLVSAAADSEAVWSINPSSIDLTSVHDREQDVVGVSALVSKHLCPSTILRSHSANLVAQSSQSCPVAGGTNRRLEW
jgi:hypothetical protein